MTTVERKEKMAKMSVKFIILGAAIAFALAGCAPFGCMLR